MSTETARGEPTRSRHCRQVLRVLQSYLDGVLDDTTAGYVAAHLASCRHCLLEAETYQQLKNALAGRRQNDATVVQRLHEFGQTLSDEADETSPRDETLPKEGSFGG